MSKRTESQTLARIYYINKLHEACVAGLGEFAEPVDNAWAMSKFITRIRRLSIPGFGLTILICARAIASDMIVLSDYVFSPSEITINVGDTIEFNDAKGFHAPHVPTQIAARLDRNHHLGCYRHNLIHRAYTIIVVPFTHP